MEAVTPEQSTCKDFQNFHSERNFPRDKEEENSFRSHETNQIVQFPARTNFRH